MKGCDATHTFKTCNHKHAHTHTHTHTHLCIENTHESVKNDRAQSGLCSARNGHWIGLTIRKI